MPATLVIQSHRHPLPYTWMHPCLDSVQGWARDSGFEYRFLDDALFDHVDTDLRDKLRDRPVIASDLARLRWMQQLLECEFECVVWCDADFLIFDRAAFELPQTDYALGREIWVQRDGERLQVFPKVHNAFLMFRRGNAFLDFYADTAARLLHLNQGRMPPQFIGPKLLSALHNIAQCPVMDLAGMLSPAVIRDLLAGGGAALDRFRQASPLAPVGANLSASLCAREALDESAMTSLIELLLDAGID
jgi:hypothetical protein